jgi:L-rhamnose mutarotase
LRAGSGAQCVAHREIGGAYEDAAGGGEVMERVCFLLKVRPERLAEYKERHKAVWPEMLAALRETGWRNYSLFLRDDGLLVGYLEAPDFQAALRGMAGREVNERWQREMAPFFEALDGRRPDEGMLALEEVFHLE